MRVCPRHVSRFWETKMVSPLNEYEHRRGDPGRRLAYLRIGFFPHVGSRKSFFTLFTCPSLSSLHFPVEDWSRAGSPIIAEEIIKKPSAGDIKVSKRERERERVGPYQRAVIARQSLRPTLCPIHSLSLSLSSLFWSPTPFHSVPSLLAVDMHLVLQRFPRK